MNEAKAKYQLSPVIPATAEVVCRQTNRERERETCPALRLNLVNKSRPQHQICRDAHLDIQIGMNRL